MPRILCTLLFKFCSHARTSYFTTTCYHLSFFQSLLVTPCGQLHLKQQILSKSFHLNAIFQFKEKTSNVVNNKKDFFLPNNVVPRAKTRQPAQHDRKNKDEETNICITYSTADCYRFASLTEYVAQDVRMRHIELSLDITNAVVFHITDKQMVSSDDGGYIVFFREGAISFWNIAESTIIETMRLTDKYEIEPYKKQVVKWERELMEYKFISGPSRFHKNSFELSNDNSYETTCSEIYAFSNALSMSVKLAHWEHALDRLIESLESMPRALMKGSLLRYQTPKMVLQKIGEVFMMRHKLNLQYNMLDVPDVYWDRENLEQLYVATTEFLNISLRVKIMNEKLSYCAHMIELVKSHMAEQKSMRIELLIVLLILIEVLFEVMHFYIKPYFNELKEQQTTS